MQDASRSPLLTDLYQLTMLQSYLDQGMTETAVFEFFVRRLPEGRNFLVAAGLEQLLLFLQQARFQQSELEYLAGTGRFRDNLLDYLADFRFRGSVHAMAEGTVFFRNEPVVRVTASLPEAQLLETRLINLLQYQIMVASKAARCRLVAGQRQLVEFGLRRAHGAEAGLLSARAACLAGFDGTANVLAGMEYGLPIVGTMAHSYILAHETEQQAFRHFAQSHPDNVILLIDTYNIARGARRVCQLVPDLAKRGIRIKGVRIDSGDLAIEARRVRDILDQHGLQEVIVFASGDLDEFRIRELLTGGAPIDGFGVGTSLTTCADSPSLNCAYKLEAYAKVPRRKKSQGKATWPGAKQVYRHYEGSGTLQEDRLCSADEQVESGKPLLQQVLAGGEPCLPAASLDESRTLLQAELASLPEALLGLEVTAPFEPWVSPHLRELATKTDQRFAR